MRRRMVTLLVAMIGVVATALVVTQTPALAYTCPATGAACLYLDNNFNNNVSVVRVASSFSGLTIDGKMSSIRNRTNCTVFLYDGYLYTGSFITVGAQTEVASLGTKYGSYWNDRIHSMWFNTATGNC